MLFFNLLFIFTYLYGLIKGKLFYNVLNHSAELEVKKARGEIDEIPKEEVMKTGLIGWYMLFYVIAQFIFVYKSLTIDPLLYPTIVVIVYIFIGFMINLNRTSKKDLTTEIGRMKYLSKVSRRFTFQGILLKLIYLAYFCYMFTVLTTLI